MTKLSDYGIQTENTDYRFHVSVVSRAVYGYETKAMLGLIDNSHYYERKAYTDGQVSALGYIVPVTDLKRIRGIIRTIPIAVMTKFPILKTDNTSKKGRQAVKIVKAMLRRGNIRLPYVIQEYEPYSNEQYQGIDLHITSNWKIQVKCDFDAGQLGTGNIYVQTKERNIHNSF